MSCEGRFHVEVSCLLTGVPLACPLPVCTQGWLIPPNASPARLARLAASQVPSAARCVPGTPTRRRAPRSACAVTRTPSFQVGAPPCRIPELQVAGQHKVAIVVGHQVLGERGLSHPFLCVPCCLWLTLGLCPASKCNGCVPSANHCRLSDSMLAWRVLNFNFSRFPVFADHGRNRMFSGRNHDMLRETLIFPRELEM